MEIWALIDKRPGNDSQTIGLANSLGLKYDIKYIEYNKLSIIPNIFIGKSLITVKNKNSIKGHYPDLLIAAGRRLGPISLYIKKHSPKTKIIHIMSPEIYINDFDMIILPEHDCRKSDKIINITGAIHKINKKLLDDARSKFTNILNELHPPYISVLVGGSSKGKKFTVDDANKLIDQLNLLNQKIKGSFLITASRRTSKEIVKLFEDKLSPKYIYIPGNNTENPYAAILAYADVIVVTGDSISMISEAGFLGKEMYIYTNKSFCSKKHLEFHNSCFNSGLAQNFDLYENFENNNICNIKLDEAKRLAEIILKKFNFN